MNTDITAAYQGALSPPPVKRPRSSWTGPKRSIPALLSLMAVLTVSGCQQLPADHWAGRPCTAKDREAGKCYPPAVSNTSVLG